MLPYDGTLNEVFPLAKGAVRSDGGRVAPAGFLFVVPKPAKTIP